MLLTNARGICHRFLPPGDRRLSSGGRGIPLPIGAEVIVKHSRAATYPEAIKEWEMVWVGDRVAIRYNPRGERDAFGNFPHYVFTIKNSVTSVELLLGRDDIQSHGLLKKEEVETAIKEKDREVRGYRSKMAMVEKYCRFCDLGEAEKTLVARAGKEIGDADYSAVLALFSKVEGVLLGRGYDFKKEVEYRELFEVYEELDKAGFKEFYFTGEEIEILDVLYVKWNDAEELLNNEEAQTLNQFYQRVISLQHALRTSAALWAHDNVAETYRFEDCLQAAAAWQANLYAANLYAERTRSGEIKQVIDLGAGRSPLYEILRAMEALPQERIIDVDHDQTAYAKAKNPLRIRASITSLGSILEKTEEGLLIQSSSFDLATSIFVYTHLNREQRKMAVAEGLRILRPGGEMLIVMPESFGFSRSFVRGAIELGGEIISMESPEPNKLGPDEKQACRKDFGPGVLRIVEGLVAKRFQVLRLKKVKDVTPEVLAKVDSELFYFMRQRAERTRGTGEKEETELSKDYLMALAYVASGGLQPQKIKVAVGELIPAEVIEEQYKGFGKKYVELRCLVPILPRRDLRRLDRIEVACNQNRAVSRADIEWMVALHLGYWQRRINAATFIKLFPDAAVWRRSRDFSALTIGGTGVQEVFSYPEEQRGALFSMMSVLTLIRTVYAPAVGLEVGRLVLELTEEELKKTALTVNELAELIGCSRDAIYLSIRRDGDNRLSPHLLPGDSGICLFNDRLVRRDLELLKVSFGGRGLQTGEITISDLARLIGCHTSGIRNAIKRKGDARLAPYLLPSVRVVQGQKAQVFDEAAVKRDLAKIREAFGLGGERLPPQPGELTTSTLAELVGIDQTSVHKAIKTESDKRLAPYLLDKERVIAGKAVYVFDEAAVKRDLAKIREAFGLGGERLPPQPGELTSSALAELVGIARASVNKVIKTEGDKRLTSYLLNQIRVVYGTDTRVFDETRVRKDLERLKEIFGKGGARLPIQPSEITVTQLAALIGCGSSTIWDALKKEGDKRLTNYLLSHTRTGKTGHDVIAFDQAKVMRDLEQLKRAFGKGG